MPAALSIFGVRVDNLTTGEVLDRVDRAIEARTFTSIAFVNADCLNKAFTDDGYRHLLGHFSMVLPDGVGVRLAAAWNGDRVRENINGTDLLPHLCDRLARRRRRIFLYGAAPGVADQVARWIEHHYAGAIVCGSLDGYSGAPQAVAAAIEAAAPDVLLVALGAPMQETWIMRHAARTGATIVLGVGGLFDFYSGRIPRAPLWLRRLSLEWAYRLWQEPGRLWKRYLPGNVLFLARMFAGGGSRRTPGTQERAR